MDEVVEVDGGLAGHAGDEVFVGGHRESGVGVTESFGHDFDWCPGGDEEAGVRMAEVVIMPMSA